MKMICMYSPLPELGMDSITGLEIKNTLEQHDIFLSPKEIMALTFAQLEKIQKEGKTGKAIFSSHKERCKNNFHKSHRS